MNILPIEKRTQIIGMLVEGMSMRSTARLADVSINTVTKLLIDVGNACADYQDATLRNLRPARIQIDEIWSFIGAKQKNFPADTDPSLGLGDCYTFTAIDPDTKLMPCWLVGVRTRQCTEDFIEDLASRMAPGHRPQLTSDGFHCYPDAIEKFFARNVDYAMLVKKYGAEGPIVEAKRRYSPAPFQGASQTIVNGSPDKKHISTSHVERANLSMRMGMRRFTRLTNAFSKKLDNHMAAVSLHFMHYNFGRVHKTLRVTPAMQAGVADHVWTIDEIVRLMPEPVAKKRGPYKPRLAA